MSQISRDIPRAEILNSIRINKNLISDTLERRIPVNCCAWFQGLLLVMYENTPFTALSAVSKFVFIYKWLMSINWMTFNKTKSHEWDAGHQAYESRRLNDRTAHKFIIDEWTNFYLFCLRSSDHGAAKGCARDSSFLFMPRSKIKSQFSCGWIMLISICKDIRIH